MIAIVRIPLLLGFQNWRRKHNKDLELIEPETPQPEQPRGQSVTSAVPNPTEAPTTPVRPVERREPAPATRLQKMAAA